VEKLSRVDYEEGDRVAWMRVAPLSGDIQIIPATVVGVVDDYQVVIRFGSGDEFTLPASDLTPMPKSSQ
jgi:hypothetical protein